MTVEQVLARQVDASGRRRAARRSEVAPQQETPAHRAPAPPSDGSSGVRAGLPPVPGAAQPGPPAPGAQPGLPPVPGSQGGSPAAAQPQAGPPSVPGSQPGLPPVPGSQPGLPPVPGSQAGLPPLPGGGGPGVWAPDERPSRRSGPIPPLPGLAVPPAPPAGRRHRSPDRPPRSPGRRRLLRSATALAVVLGVVVLYHLALYVYVDQRIDRVEALATDGPEVLAPDLQDAADTYLVVGTGVPGQTGAASVATLVATVSAEGDRAVLVSVPPTALVDTPMCRTPDGDLRNPVTEAFASSLLDGGPACMVRAVQQLSGLRIDHYLGVDLTGLPGMVEALGGIPVCVIPSEATAAAAQPPPAGPSRLSGAAAAGFLAPGDPGLDVSGAAVAERAQRLLTSTLRSAMSADTLLDPLTLTRFLNRASDSLTVDPQTTLGDLRVLAGTLGDLSGDAVHRAGLPVAQVGYVPTGSEQAYVVLDRPATRDLFDEVIDGARLPAEVLEAQRAASTPVTDAAPAPSVPAGPEPLTVEPAQITVDVLNATGTTGLAGTVADAMRGQGFRIGTVGNEPGTVDQSVVRFGPGAEEQARTVAAAVTGAVLQPSDAIGSAVQLVIGPGYTTVVPVQVGVPAVQDTAADDAPAAPVPDVADVRC